MSAKFYIPSDPLFPLQWHLFNQGNTQGAVSGYDINVMAVWPEYSGRGVLIGVMDDGMDDTHPDLVPNYRPDLAWDVYLDQPGATVRSADDEHGVSVAGLAAAAADNGIGGVGVAWGADFTMFRTPLMGEAVWLSLTKAADKMIHGGVDVSINSWGPSLSPFSKMDVEGIYYQTLRDMAEFGRDGLGIATVYAAGNSRSMGFDTNESPTTNNPWTIVVAASTQAGGITSYSTKGASVLVTAPGSDPSSMITTDRQGAEGYNTDEGVAGNYTDRGDSFFDGTSAAAPVAGGVVALILDANRGLGYRDVQEILAYSSKRATFLDREYEHTLNGARDWNGGSLLVGHDFGFGHIDAQAAVRLAESWMKVGTVRNLVTESGAVAQRSATVEAGHEFSTAVRFDPGYRVERLSVTVEIDAARLQGITLDLISPHGTVSRLIDEPAPDRPLWDKESNENDAGDEDDGYYVLPTSIQTTLGTVHHWGENLSGEWQLRLSNNADGDVVYLRDWALEAHTAGAPDMRGHAQIFTDEFARFADLQPGRVVIDAAQGGVLNAAAVTHDLRLDLSGGPSSIGDTVISLADPAAFAHVISGDGNDVLSGNGADNILMAGRGVNHVDGGGGLDVMRFIGESSGYALERLDGALAVESTTFSHDSRDILLNVEILHFADQVKLGARPEAAAGDLFDEAAYLMQNSDVAAAVEAGLLGSGREHYQQWGMAEGRNPNNLFSEAWYLAVNGDVANAVQGGDFGTGFLHYQLHGWAEGRIPSAWMDTSAYLSRNDDVAAAGMNPLEHYLLYGYDEGREITALPVDMWV